MTVIFKSQYSIFAHVILRPRQFLDVAHDFSIIFILDGRSGMTMLSFEDLLWTSSHTQKHPKKEPRV